MAGLTIGGIAAIRFHAHPNNTYKPKDNVPDPKFMELYNAVANGKTWEFKPAAVWRQADGAIYIDCNVAGKVLVTS